MLLRLVGLSKSLRWVECIPPHTKRKPNPECGASHAIYMKADWLSEFEKHETREERFSAAGRPASSSSWAA
jgi:hypothetical protein